jgi:hypothetical protein
MTSTGITGRDGFLLGQAFAVAIETLAKRPDLWRPESDIEDMRRLLTHLAGPRAARWRLEQERLTAQARQAEVAVARDKA